MSILSANVIYACAGHGTHCSLYDEYGQHQAVILLLHKPLMIYWSEILNKMQQISQIKMELE